VVNGKDETDTTKWGKVPSEYNRNGMQFPRGAVFRRFNAEFRGALCSGGRNRRCTRMNADWGGVQGPAQFGEGASRALSSWAWNAVSEGGRCVQAV